MRLRMSLTGVTNLVTLYAPIWRGNFSPNEVFYALLQMVSTCCYEDGSIVLSDYSAVSGIHSDGPDSCSPSTAMNEKMKSRSSQTSRKVVG